MGSVGVFTNSVLVCAPLMSQSVEQMVSDMHEAKAQGADVVEIRLDCVKDFRSPQDLKFLLKNKPLPVVIVYRPKWEGGQYDGDENMRLETLRLAKQLGADYVDLELQSNLQSNMFPCNLMGTACCTYDTHFLKLKYRKRMHYCTLKSVIR